MTLCLTHDEIIELTHKIRYSAQKSALNLMGISHKVRPDGSPFVLKDAIEEHLKMREPKKTRPNFEALRNAQA